MGTAIPIIIFLLILGIVIFVHELGHFFAARRAGIFVEEFAMGMGPKLFSFKGKKKFLLADFNEDDMAMVVGGGPAPAPVPVEYWDSTLYSLRAFPIGGFCKMRGMDEDLPNDPMALNNKSIPARMLVMAGGSLMNFLLAFIIFFAIAVLWGYQVPEVRSVRPSSPGYEAGLVPGDRITHINGTRTSLYDDYLFMVLVSSHDTMDLRVRRGAETLNMQMTPLITEAGQIVLGFSTQRRYGFLSQVPEGEARRVVIHESMLNAGQSIVHHIRTPFRMLSRFVTRQPLPEGGVMGPIGLGGAVTEVYQIVSEYGFLETLYTMLFIAAIINAALGVMNLLPIPALDGARLVFLALEGIRKKPVTPEREAMVHLVGLVALLLLAVFIAYRDIVRLI